MDIQALLIALKEEAARVDAIMHAELAAVEDSELREVLVYAVCNGGKRIRPLLTMLFARMASTEKRGTADEENDLYRLAIVFEYLHAASLLHDDVIDNAEKRRGRPAANTLWGVNLTILAGDWLHARAMRTAGSVGGGQCADMTGRATEAMVAAEFLQRDIAAAGNASEEEYFQVLEGKTASLIAAACEVGILAAGGNDGKRSAAARYGHHIGLAFQIVDDLLDYLGDTGKTGKAVGNDFQEGKITLPLILALDHGGEELREELIKLLHKEPSERMQYFVQARTLIEKARGFHLAREKAALYIDEAKETLARFPEGKQRELLAGLADYILLRDK